MDRDKGLRRTTAITGALVAASLAGTLAVGIAAYLAGQLGAGPIESAALAWDPPLPFRWSYGIAQGASALVGWWLGGTLGVGTVAVVVLLGPLVEAVGRVHPDLLGRTLPLNGAGVCGAALCDLGFSPEILRGFALLARTAAADGIGSCPNGVADPEALAALLGHGEDEQVATVLSFGYPAEPVDLESRTPEEWIARAGRMPFDEVVELR